MQYIGIAKDEPQRLGRIKGSKISLLDKYGYTEQMARELCERYDLLSPIYGVYNRNDCWFCPNTRIRDLLRLKQNHPDLWGELEQLSKTENLCSYGFKWGKTFEQVDKRLTYIAKVEDWNSRQLNLFE